MRGATARRPRRTATRTRCRSTMWPVISSPTSSEAVAQGPAPRAGAGPSHVYPGQPHIYSSSRWFSRSTSVTGRSRIRVARISSTLTITRLRIDAYRVRCSLPSSHVHVISHCLQRRDRRLRKSIVLDIKNIGLPLMMEARRLHRVGDSHVEVDLIQNHFQHRINDGATAGTADDGDQSTIL